MAGVERLGLVFPESLHALSIVQNRMGKGISHDVKKLPNALCCFITEIFQSSWGRKLLK